MTFHFDAESIWTILISLVLAFIWLYSRHQVIRMAKALNTAAERTCKEIQKRAAQAATESRGGQ